jgi:transposase
MPVTSMPQSALPAQDAPSEEVVLGVDTHRDTHVAAVVTLAGRLAATSAFPATAAGYRRMLAWARSLGVVERAGVECTGSYGVALSRYLQGEGIAVIDVNQPDRATRRRRGKTDAVDAEAAARAVLSGRSSSIAKAGDGLVEAMRVLKLARGSAVNARTKAINQLRAILVGADPALRESLAGLGPGTLIRACASLDDPGVEASDVERAVIYTLRLLANRILELKAESYELHKRISELVTRCAPQLLERPGVGPDSAAALLIAAGDNPQRLRRESSYAALCGVSPVESLLRQHPATPAEPRRRPAGQRRALPHHPVQAPLGPAHPALPATPPVRRQNPPRSHPLPQALHRPRNLRPAPNTGRPACHLTSIGASGSVT